MIYQVYIDYTNVVTTVIVDIPTALKVAFLRVNYQLLYLLNIDLNRHMLLIIRCCRMVLLNATLHCE